MRLVVLVVQKVITKTGPPIVISARHTLVPTQTAKRTSMKKTGNIWLDFCQELSQTYQREAFEKILAESSVIRSELPKVVNPVTLLTIGMLQGLLSLRKYAEPTSTLVGWEKEAYAFLSGVSIYGLPVDPSSSQKAN